MLVNNFLIGTDLEGDRPQILIATDALVSPGGADRVLKSLLKLYPNADILTSVYDPAQYPWLSQNTVHTTFIQRLPFQSYWKKYYVLLSPLGFEQFDTSNYDLVVSLSAGCAKGVITSPETIHIAITMTPPRALWFGEGRRKMGKFNPYGLLTPIFKNYHRIWDVEASMRPDIIVSISKYIAERVKSVYGRDSRVIYPGIDMKFWTRGKPTKAHCPDKPEDFYLVVSRLYDYKRVDLAIAACERLNKKLVIIGTGPSEKYLRSRSTSQTTKFLGYLPDKQARDYMRRAHGFLFPGLEDFGLAPVEAMACGCPVIAYNRGGLVESVEKGRSGELFDEQATESLISAIQRFEEKSWDRKVVAAHAQQFSEENFLNQFTEVLRNEQKN